jgi:hypothetical protein
MYSTIVAQIKVHIRSISSFQHCDMIDACDVATSHTMIVSILKASDISII